MGTPNRVTVEARILVDQLVSDLKYQTKLRHDFRLRKVHPTIEALIWSYHLGRPQQRIDIAARIDIDATARLVEERRAFSVLDVSELEQLAMESQAMVDRALALAEARVKALTPQQVGDSPDLPEVSGESLTKEAGSDKSGYVVQEPEPEDDKESPDGSTA
jgi:hypothetical protein